MILMDLSIVKNLCNQIKAVFICETSFICIKSGIGKKNPATGCRSRIVHCSRDRSAV